MTIQTKSSHQFYAFRIMRVIHSIRGWSYELQDVFLKNKQIPGIAKVNISFISFDDSRWKKRVFKNAVLCVKKGFKLEIFLVLYSECLWMLRN